MARLSDFHRAVKIVGFGKFLKRILDESTKDNLLTWAAALSYSWLFAIFPFFISLLSLIPYLPSHAKDRALAELRYELKQVIPESADLIWNNIENNSSSLLNQPRGLLLYAGLGVALWAASSGVSMTMAALDRCYEIDVGRPFYVQRPLAIALTLAVIAMLFLIGCLLPVASAFKFWVIKLGYATRLPFPIMLFDFVRWALSLLFMLLVLSVMYWKGPAVRHRFHIFTPGSVFSVSVWVILAIAFRVYVDKVGGRGYEKTYGALGGVAILMLFFYIDALVLLIGAEINAEIDFAVRKIPRGSRDFTKFLDTVSAEPTSL